MDGAKVEQRLGRDLSIHTIHLLLQGRVTHSHSFFPIPRPDPIHYTITIIKFEWISHSETVARQQLFLNTRLFFSLPKIDSFT